mgnify:CR=1 FL=1
MDGFVRPDHSHERDERKSGVNGAVDTLKDLAVTLGLEGTGSPVDELVCIDHSHKMDERKSGVNGAVDRLTDLVVTLLSLKSSSSESAASLNRREPSKGMFIRLAWTSPEKPVDWSQVW